MNCYSSIALKCFPRNVTLLGGYWGTSFKYVLHATFFTAATAYLSVLFSLGVLVVPLPVDFRFFDHHALKSAKQKLITTEHL